MLAIACFLLGLLLAFSYPVYRIMRRAHMRIWLYSFLIIPFFGPMLCLFVVAFGKWPTRRRLNRLFD